MSEQPPIPERQPAQLTEAQEATLRKLCDRYAVEFDPAHYAVYSDTAVMLPGWAEGWIGGSNHANPDYMQPTEPVGKPTLYVGVSPEGEAHS